MLGDPATLLGVGYLAGVLHVGTAVLVYERGRARGRVEGVEEMTDEP